MSFKLKKLLKFGGKKASKPDMAQDLDRDADEENPTASKEPETKDKKKGEETAKKKPKVLNLPLPPSLLEQPLPKDLSTWKWAEVDQWLCDLFAGADALPE